MTLIKQGNTQQQALQEAYGLSVESFLESWKQAAANALE